MVCEDGFYLSSDDQCVTCDPACATCSDETTMKCGSCNEGYAQLPDSTVCVPSDKCPTGFTYDNSLLQCVSPGDIEDVEYCFEFSDKQVEQTINEVIVSYAGIPEDGPYAVYQRGIYFSSGNSALTLDGLALSTSFTLEFWIKAEGDGSLLDISTYADFDLESLVPRLEKGDLVASGQALTNEWHRVLYVIDAAANSLRICRNDDCYTSEFMDPFVDSLDYAHTIGLVYTGFLYKFCAYQYVNYPLPIESSECEQGYCSNCPPGACVIDCAITHTLVDGSCAECNDCPQGCIYPEDCDMCLDRYCATCSNYENCETCAVNAEFNPETGICECDASHRPSDDFQCVDCNPACALCEDETNTTCDECNEGFFKQPDTRQCEEYCPTLLDVVGRECRTVPNKSVCFTFPDKDIPAELTLSPTSQPISIYQRGLYFDGVAYVDLTDFVLNTSFTIEMYLWYPGGVSHGSLFEALKDVTVWCFYLSELDVKFHPFGINVPYIPKGEIGTNQWVSTALVVKPGQASIYVDGALADQVVNENILFLDSLESIHRIGNGFIGMIYYMCISQFANTEFEVPDPLPPSCSHDQTVDCEDCPEGCETGCMRSSDCRNCLDALCETCENYGTCEQCIENAELDGVCTCNDPNYYQTDIDKCQPCPEPCTVCSTSDTCDQCKDGWYLDGQSCKECYADCETCSSGERDNCDTCPDGKFMNPDVNICQATCPSGYVEINGRCAASDNLDFCFEFSDKAIAQTTNGASTVLDASPDTDPVAILSRGIYFDGDDFFQITGLSLNTVSTMEFWIRPENSGTLLKISTIDVEYSLQYSVLTFGFGDDEQYSNTVENTWTHVAYVVNVKSLEMYINNTQVYAGELQDILIDQVYYYHVVGVEYEGFMYKICAKNYALTSFEVEEGKCVADLDCFSCPVGVCLSECAHDQLIEEDRTCRACLPECTDGCIRATDCGKCEDELCDSCSEYATCDICIENASKTTDSDCTCDEPLVFSRDEGVCRECHEHCEECQDGTLECTLCQDGYYNDPSFNPDSSEDDCRQCNEACATCSDASTDCPTCNDGFYKLPHTRTCVNYCPSLLLNNANECNEEPLQQKCFEFLNIQLPDGLTTSSAAPTPIYQRGLWFDGTNGLVLDQLVLSTYFTIEIYFNSASGGQLYAVTGSNLEWSIQHSSGQIELFAGTTIVHRLFASQDEWHQVAMTMFLGQAYLTLDTIKGPVVSTPVFIDTPDSEHKLGDGYEGLIYQTCVYQYKKDEFTLLDPLPNDCDYNQVSETCEDCLEGCDACIRPTDCRNCLDDLCDECFTFETCHRCIAGAELIDGSCTCQEGKQYFEDIDMCSVCIEDCKECSTSTTCDVCEDGSFLDGETCSDCHASCGTCSDAGKTNCETCLEGSALLPGANVCVELCPSGYQPIDGKCVLDGETSSTCFSFPDKEMNQTLNGIEISWGGMETNTAKPIVNRGLYFDGNDILNVSNFMFNTKFTVEFWIRPESDGNLMEVNNDYLVMKLSNGLKASVSLELEFAEDTVSVLQGWTNVAYQFDNESLNFLINGVISSTATFSQMVLDSHDFSHVIGLDYVGYLYKLCLHNTPEVTPEITNPSCVPDVECVNCPDNICVSECLHTQFLKEDASCEDCHEDCVDGCVRYTDCRNCFDEFCSECGYYESCDVCISGAILDEETKTCACPPEKPYDRANEKCGECHKGCSDCTFDGELRCLNCDPGYYLVSDELNASAMCQLCDPACATCTSAGNESCPTCKLGYFLIPGTTHCETYCPSTLTKGTDHTCQESPEKEICFTFDDKPIERTVSDVTVAPDDESKPIIVLERGLYFDGTTRLQLDNLVLNTQFTLEFVVRAIVPGGKMLFVETPLSELFLSTHIDNSQWALQWKTENHHPGAYEPLFWYNLAVTVTRRSGLSRVQLYVNNESVGEPLTLDSLIIDSLENVHTFGTGFNGFLYRMCLYQYVKADFILDNLSNCGLNEIIQEDGTCLDCLDSCQEGCIRDTDCRTCHDPLCESCSQSFDGPCDSDMCIEGAVWEGGICSCNDPNYYQSDIDVCGACRAEFCAQCDRSTECQVCQESYYLGEDKQCHPCDPRCQICVSGSNENCEQCSDGNYKQPETNTCESTCPSGFIPEDGVCTVPSNLESLDYCFKFADSNEQTTRDITVETTESADASPKAMESRGIYFDGDDVLQMVGLNINRTFTLEFWIRPYVEEISNAGLFDIAGARTTQFTLTAFSDFSSAGFEHESFNSIGNTAVERAWIHVAYVVTSGSEVAIYVNGIAENVPFTDIIVGNPSDIHLIGQQYVGFLYSFCLRQRVFTAFDIDTTVQNCPTPLNCSNCPLQTCLSNCEFNQFLDSNECSPCLESCTKGCVRSTDCRSCADELCGTCPDSEICDECLPGAQNPEQCECQPGLQYDMSVGECVPCDDNCSACEYGTLICQECETGFYLDDVATCQQCHPYCAECSNGDNKSCPRCSEGFSLIPNTSQCQPWCPSGLFSVEEVCKETPLATICFTWDDKEVFQIDEASGVQVLYETFEDLAAFAVYQRGIYFEGTRLVLPALVLNTIFTLEFVIRPESDGKLLSIYNSDEDSFLQFELTTEAIKFTYMPDISIEGESWNLKTWQNVAVTVQLTQVTLYLDNVQVGTSVTRDEISVDDLENIHAIGQDYTGFMYKFCVYQFAQFFFDITPPPSNCDLDQVGPDCQDCPEECAQGCVTTDNCRLCEDPLCEACDTYAGCNDDGCIENASENTEGVCQCELPFVYMQEILRCGTCVAGCETCSNEETCESCQSGYFLNEDLTCTECNENCAECTDATRDCTVCSDDSVHMPGTTICVTECPSGYDQVDKTCLLVQATHCFEFTNKQLELTSGTVSIVSTGADPNPMQTRGIFFDGDDSLELSNLTFNSEFVLDFWLRAYVDPVNNGNLLNVSGSIDVLFGLSKNQPGIEYLITHYSNAVLSKEWTHLCFTIS